MVPPDLEDTAHYSIFGKAGGHYNILSARGDGIDVLHSVFPEAEANDLNFVLFSTSGIHGSSVTIEEIEAGVEKWGWDGPNEEEGLHPLDWFGTWLTFLIVQPRLVTLSYGEVEVTPENIGYLKKLRDTSWAAVQTIGRNKA